MIGKKLRINDYKLTYGQGTAYINIYGVFRDSTNGNKYAIYSYEGNNSLFYGTFFKRNKEAVIMISKSNSEESIKIFVDLLLSEKMDDRFEIISLEDIDTVQIIEEYKYKEKVDINKLYDLTIPKPIIEEEIDISNKKKSISIAGIFFGLFIVVILLFFFFNPEVIVGKNTLYECSKSYFHKTLPASVNEVISLTFDSKNKVIDINSITDYVFNDIEYYVEFREKGYFYQHTGEADTYKFIDENYTYRVFSEIDTFNNFFLPTKEDELLSYYKNDNYICKVVEINE